MSRFWFQPPRTEVAQRISDLHVTLLWIVLGIMVVVFGLMIYSLLRHRKSVGAIPAQFEGNQRFELIWTIIPIIIVVGMAWPATSAVLFMKDTSHADMLIKITGYQWKWRYEYLTEGVSLYSQLSTPRAQIENAEPKGENYLLEVDNPLVVPVGKKVRILVTANDVIHSWWVPAFGVKQDGIPGFVKESWFRVDSPGIYRGQCAELCGKDHGFMPIVVKAVPQEEYAAWVTKKVATATRTDAASVKEYTFSELKEAGAKIYVERCAGCHQPAGQGLPPTFPALMHGKVATGPIAGAVDIVLNGSKTNPAMAAWKDLLSDTELAQVITYVRNDFGNSTGDLMQPKDVSAARH
jgi:cytochrome c oxidase subunit II